MQYYSSNILLGNALEFSLLRGPMNDNADVMFDINRDKTIQSVHFKLERDSIKLYTKFRPTDNNK